MTMTSPATSPVPAGKSENRQIAFTVRDCSFGKILIALSQNGISLLSLGDSPEPLEADMKKRFPNAIFKNSEKSEEPLIQQVLDFVENRSPDNPDIPVDLRGTGFQMAVWRELRNIPHGKTVTYTQLAEKIGRPTAVRAVAGACGANPVAILIPCHRAVRSDGSISGYRWGQDRKRKLLERERP